MSSWHCTIGAKVVFKTEEGEKDHSRPAGFRKQKKRQEKKKETEIEREQVIESKIEREGAQLKQDK